MRLADQRRHETAALGSTRRHETRTAALPPDAGQDRGDTEDGERLERDADADRERAPWPRSRPVSLELRRAAHTTMARATQSSGCPQRPATLATAARRPGPAPAGRGRTDPSTGPRRQSRRARSTPPRAPHGPSTSQRLSGWPEPMDVRRAGPLPERRAGPAPGGPRRPEARSAPPSAHRHVRTGRGRAPTRWPARLHRSLGVTRPDMTTVEARMAQHAVRQDGDEHGHRRHDPQALLSIGPHRGHAACSVIGPSGPADNLLPRESDDAAVRRGPGGRRQALHPGWRMEHDRARTRCRRPSRSRSTSTGTRPRPSHHWELFFEDADGRPVMVETPEGPSRSRCAASSRSASHRGSPRARRSTWRWR